MRIRATARGSFAYRTRASSETQGRCLCLPTSTRPWRMESAIRPYTPSAEGSAAAPTAGLHFTPELLDSLHRRGIRLAEVTLHVGVDTFRPVRSEDPGRHKLHSEYFHLDEEAAREISRAKEDGRRVVCVGTTSVRLLEQAALLAEAGGSATVAAASGWADLFILPGHRFRLVDGLITNFHLPRSTLLMLVSAFAGRGRAEDEGRRLILRAYREAIEQGYRFYSFGDCMAIL